MGRITPACSPGPPAAAAAAHCWTLINAQRRSSVSATRCESGEIIRLTPSYQREAPQVLGVGAEGHEDEAVQIEALHQDPVVVGGQEVDEEEHRQLAANLTERNRTKK